jgi:hypothetical protein
MRASDVRNLTAIWYEILSEYQGRNQEIMTACLHVVGLYVGEHTVLKQHKPELLIKVCSIHIK